jgi:psp operon transcriptional activator
VSKPQDTGNHDVPRDGQGHPRVQDAIGASEAFLGFQEQLSRVAKVDRPVLLIGERGSGKELAASRIHFLSSRWQNPFIALNCAALASSLIESELFGHEAGAFTGAGRRRRGRFEAADSGTLLLDEIGNIPLETQEKILRVVEYGHFERVGGSDSVEVDVRIIGATNADLVSLSRRGRFMRDLLDRLSFEVLFVPPLRARREDIMVLSNHFAARMSMELGWHSLPEFTEEAVEKLEHYPWPGNVRELKNVVERAVYRSDDDIITAEEVVFDPFISPYGPQPRAMDGGDPVERRTFTPGTDDPSLLPTRDGSIRIELSRPFEESVRDVELCLLTAALEEAKYNQRKAAELLGLTYHQFRGLYRKYKDDLAV